MPSDPVQRVAEAIRLAAEARAQSRGHHQSQPPGLHPREAAAAAAFAATGPPTPTTPVPATRRAEETPVEPPSSEAEVPPPEEVIPHIYDGDERACSLCLEEFTHGQQVCRLTCRHMFHAACWEGLTVTMARR